MFAGSIAALVTPFNEDLTIDWQAINDLVEWHVSVGTDALVINGTTGESATLAEQEKLTILERVLDLVAGRMPIIAATGHPSTVTTINQSKQAQKLGADACLVVTPYYNRPTQEGLYQHYLAVAENVDVPIIAYNVPKRTGCDLLPETLARFADVKNIIGIKDASGDLTRIKAYQALSPNRFTLLSGDDSSALEFMLHGGHGVISVVSNIAPATMRALCAVARNKAQTHEAIALNDKLTGLYLDLQAEPNPITVKWLLAEMGKIKNILRLPLTPLQQPYHSLLAPWVAKLGMMELQNANKVFAYKEDSYA